jgi:hypothetical protein
VALPGLGGFEEITKARSQQEEKRQVLIIDGVPQEETMCSEDTSDNVSI